MKQGSAARRLVRAQENELFYAFCKIASCRFSNPVLYHGHRSTGENRVRRKIIPSGRVGARRNRAPGDSRAINTSVCPVRVSRDKAIIPATSTSHAGVTLSNLFKDTKHETGHGRKAAARSP